VNGQNVIPEIYEVKEKMKSFSSLVISGREKGTQETPIVNIGIGALT
jgi:glucose-6-phosphate isomerase